MNTVLTAGQLGKVLKGFRRAQKLTQKEAGETVGLLQKTVSKLERDTETATIESLFKLMSSLGLEMSVRAKNETYAQSQSKNEW